MGALSFKSVHTKFFARLKCYNHVLILDGVFFTSFFQSFIYLFIFRIFFAEQQNTVTRTTPFLVLSSMTFPNSKTCPSSIPIVKLISMIKWFKLHVKYLESHFHWHWCVNQLFSTDVSALDTGQPTTNHWNQNNPYLSLEGWRECFWSMSQNRQSFTVTEANVVW